MDQAEAARRFGVAESEMVGIRPAGDWWEALHHDMASHEETWRTVPGAPELTLERDSGTVEPATGGIVSGPVDLPDDGCIVPVDVKSAAKRRSRS